jgi:hypothetical protein
MKYESYMELLLLACSAYDKKLIFPGKQKRAVYQTKIDNNDNTNCYGNNGKADKAQATFIPRDEWNKLTQEQKD